MARASYKETERGSVSFEKTNRLSLDRLEQVCFGFLAQDIPLHGLAPVVPETASLGDLLEQALKEIPGENPVLLLSGGVDSSLLGALLHLRLGRAFEPITFYYSEAPGSDLEWSRRAAAEWGMVPRLLPITTGQILETLENAPACGFDGNINAFQSVMYAKKLGPLPGRALVTGLGPDEWLGGAVWSQMFWRTGRRPSAWCGSRAWVFRHVPFRWLDSWAQALRLRSLVTPRTIRMLSGCRGMEAALLHRWQRIWERLPGHTPLERFQSLTLALDLEIIQRPAFATLARAASTSAVHPFLTAGVRGYWLRFSVEERWGDDGQKTLLRPLAGEMLPPDLAGRPKEGTCWSWAQLLRGPLWQVAERRLFTAPWKEMLGIELPHLKREWRHFLRFGRSSVGALEWMRLVLLGGEGGE